MPIEQDDNQEDLRSSAQVTDVTESPAPAGAADQPEAKAPDASAAEAGVNDGAAESSPAKDETPKDVLAVVRDVVGKPADPASSAEQKTAEEDKAAKAPSDEAKEQDDTDYSDVPFHQHPRFQKLLQKSKANEADATRYRNIDGYLKQNRVSGEEAAEAIEIRALMRSDPRKALEQLKPIVRELLMRTGEALPDDLKSRVQAGDLSADSAIEISRSRAAAAAAEQRQREMDDQRRQDQQAQQGQMLRGAAEAWLRDRDTRDPSFQSKFEPLQREIAYMQRNEGVPNTPEGVRDQLNRAYSAVNQQVRSNAPASQPAQRPAMKPLTGGAAPGKPAPQPTSILDVIQQRIGA